CGLRISLLTCSPGEELYSTFGHTALRVQDMQTGTDHVYNYGSFEFGPDFYTEFIKGKLLYFLSVEDFSDFMYQYEYERRSVQEQVVLLDCNEKQNLLNALQKNAEEQNKYYRYDFLFDNCTTRAGDMVAAQSDTPVIFNNILPAETPSFRNLLHTYLDRGQQPWSKLGIDILLGSRLDRKVTNREAMFLPDYLLKGFDSARVNGRPLVSAPVTILESSLSSQKNSLFTPAVVFSLVLLIVLAISFVNKPWAIRTLMVFDFILFLELGLAGLLLLFMWFGTDHIVCRDNFNLLWAIPTHLFAAFFVHSKKTWVRKYFTIVMWLNILLALTWFVLPQQMNPALLPIVFLVIFRSWKISKRKHAQDRKHS
ncbi:MAG: lipoprotein N-acyltransferase Lnb domain-containing protein, partial [Flavisolibacter sp.]